MPKKKGKKDTENQGKRKEAGQPPPPPWPPDAVSEAELVSRMEDVAISHEEVIVAERIEGDDYQSQNQQNQPNFDDVVEKTDVTDEFFRRAEKLGPGGRTARASNFSLFDAMSAIELGVPSMDAGCRAPSERSPSLQEKLQNGLLEKMSVEESLATLDASFAAYATWISGHSIANTLWTNLLLLSPAALFNRKSAALWAPLSDGFAHLVRLTTEIIFTASSCEDEDFSAFTGFHVDPFTQFPRDCCAALEQLEKHFAGKEHLQSIPAPANWFGAQTTTLSQVESKELLGRLRLLRNLIALLELVLQPAAAKVSDSGKDVDSAQTAYFDVGDASQMVVECERALLEIERLEEAKKKGEGNGTKDVNDGNFDWLPAFDPDVNRDYQPPSFPRKLALLDRAKGRERLSTLVRQLRTFLEPIDRLAFDYFDLVHFLRRQESDCSLVRSFRQVALFPFPDNGGSLLVFGRVDLPVRRLVVDTLLSYNHAVYLQREMSDVFYGKSSGGCCGGHDHHHDHHGKADTKEKKKKEGGVAKEEEEDDEDEATDEDDETTFHELWEFWLSDAARIFARLLSLYAFNDARRQERMLTHVDELLGLLTEAEHIDELFERRLQRRIAHGDRLLEAVGIPPHHTLAGFIGHVLVSLCRDYLEAGFQLDLYANYELHYIYWYLGRTITSWLVTSLNRAHQLVVYEQTACAVEPQIADLERQLRLALEVQQGATASGGGKPKKKKAQQLAQEQQLARDIQKLKDVLKHLRDRRAQAQHRQQMLHAEADWLNVQLCAYDAYYLVVVAMMMDGRLRVPAGGASRERLRFESRLVAFRALGVRFQVDYDFFAEQMREYTADKERGALRAYAAAAERFADARAHCARLGLNAHVKTLDEICARNGVVAKILATGERKDHAIELERKPAGSGLQLTFARLVLRAAPPAATES